MPTTKRTTCTEHASTLTSILRMFYAGLRMKKKLKAAREAAGKIDS